MHVYSYRPNGPQRPVKRRLNFKRYLLLVIVAGLAWFGYGAIINNREPAVSNNSQTQSEAQQKPQEPTVEPLPSVQAVVEEFAANNAGQYSVVVTDVAAGKELASYGAEDPYFAASIYKIYVAYLGYIDVQEGKYRHDDSFLGEWRRGECLDKMIRESHSPCAEKLWVEQGKEASTERLKKLGLTGTSMVALRTTAHDVDLILRRLHGRNELNETHTNIFMESMKNNIYRDVLPKALPDLAVYDKVGFNENLEYHDVGIVKLSNGRDVAITMLTRSAGTRRMVDLTKQIFDALTADN